jgi:hypothetical protein
MKLPVDPNSKLPKFGEAPTAPEHPNKRYRRLKEGQHYGHIDKNGDYVGPTGGFLPVHVNREAPWPEREKRREEAEAKRLKKLQRRG